MTWLRPAADYPFFDNGGLPIAFAHRGGALTGDNVGLENSMVAFETAVQMGYRYVETDVHATADGVLLAFHDTTLDRTTDRSGTIARLPYSQVAKARIGGREPIPLLGDVLAAWPQLRLNVDAKSAAAIEPLARTIVQQSAWDRVCVASFSPTRLHRLRSRVGPRVASAYGTIGVAALRLLPTRALRLLVAGRRAQAAEVPVAGYGLQVATPAFVEHAHELGKVVHVWTVDDPADMALLLDMGVDGIMSDRIDLLRDTYVARGIWKD